jgi:acetylglutamate kinase
MTMKMNNRDRDIVVAALKHAAPYIRMFKRKTFVVKAGGELFLSPANTHALLEQISILYQVGVRVVLVHGAGPQSTQLAQDRGLVPRIVEGRRVTDKQTLEVMTEVNLEIGAQILDICKSIELPAVAMGASNPGPVLACKRPPAEIKGEGPIDFGFVGDIETLDTNTVQAELDQGNVPVISALSADAGGALLNINADTVAASLASALNAEKLMLATGTAGILENLADPGSLISYLDLAGLKKLQESGSPADGMLPKAKAIETAINGGVPRVHIISYSQPDSLLLEVFTNEGTGTLVVKSIEALTDAEQATGVA